MACVFLFFAAVPLSLIPVFPDFWLMNALYTRQGAVLGLLICAGIISRVVDRVLYGKVEQSRQQLDASNGQIKHWELNGPKVDCAKFFTALSWHFSSATTLFIEGSAISQDVQQCYIFYSEVGEYWPRAQTIWPVSKKFRCHFSSSFMTDLTSLAQKHAEPELLDHLVLYEGTEELLFWHDAFDNVLLISRNVPEDVIAAFAGGLGLQYS